MQCEISWFGKTLMYANPKARGPDLGGWLWHRQAQNGDAAPIKLIPLRLGHPREAARGATRRLRPPFMRNIGWAADAVREGAKFGVYVPWLPLQQQGQQRRPRRHRAPEPA